MLCLLLTACGIQKTATDAEAAAAETADPLLKEDADKIRISEVMCKNRAVLQDEDGNFPDWIELENCSAEPVSLAGWLLKDKEEKTGWTLPDLSLDAGERVLILADGKNRPETLHSNFSLSKGETVYLYNSHGYLADTAPCQTDRADLSLCRDADGRWTESQYPTPGYPNTDEGYSAWQESLEPSGPLIISEVVVSNPRNLLVYLVGGSDWVELRNVSGEKIKLSDYCISDDHNDYCQWQLPNETLDPGAHYLVLCDTRGSEGASPTCRSFSLDDTAESLYLSKSDGTLVDYASLRDIPYSCSFGRMPGKNGWFYFNSPSPKTENSGGKRRVSRMPESAEPDGVFNGVESVRVALEGEGRIYYTTNGTVPTTASIRYTEPLEVTKTTILRAVQVEEDGIPSRVRTLSYIVNENHSLPVVSLVPNDKMTYYGMYANGSKGVETPGDVALYDENGLIFRMPCGVKMQGATSLVLPKKNLGLRFRGCYGGPRLDCDLFGGGLTSFTNLVLRAGQDYNNTVFRNELCENLALSASDAVIAQRSRECVLYVDGKYVGIYALAEKGNEQHYADLLGVSRDSVIDIKADATDGTELDREVFAFCSQNDMSQTENYETFCQRMDVDSLIDWILLEGYCANSDLTFGNLRFMRSTEGDGKWRLVFYDLDATLREPGNNYYNLLSENQVNLKPVSHMVGELMENAEFRDRMLSRAAAMLNGPLTNQKVLAEIDRLAALVEPEIARDAAMNGLSYAAWERHVRYLKTFIGENDWRQHNVDSLCQIFQLDESQREHYFGH